MSEPQIVIRPFAHVALGYRAFHLSTAESGHLLAASPEGSVSVFTPDAAMLDRFKTHRSLVSANLGPAAEMLALTFDDVVHAVSPSGEVVREIPGSCRDAWFDGRGGLWTVTVGDNEDTAIASFRKSYREREPTAQCVLQDPFGSSAWVFPKSPTRGPIALWVAAGQDGQAIYWLHEDEGRLSADLFDDCDQCTPPSFNDGGNEFLLFAESSELRRYSFPGCEILGSVVLPETDGEPLLGTAAFFIGADRAIVCAENGFIGLIDLDRMLIEASIVVDGHEPRPIADLYPSLKDDRTHGSDLATLHVAGQHQIVSVHSQLPDPKVRQHSILAWWPPI